MPPDPLPHAVVAILTPVVEMGTAPLRPATYKVKVVELSMCEKDVHYLDYLECVAKDVDDALLGISKFLSKENWQLVEYYYQKFCRYVSTFFHIIPVIRAHVMRMLYASWDEQTSLRSLFVHSQKGIDGAIRFVADTTDQAWQKAGMMMHEILRHVYDCLTEIQRVIQGVCKLGKDEVEGLCQEFDERLACSKREQCADFAARWENNGLFLADKSLEEQAQQDIIKASMPKGNILIDKDPQGTEPHNMMVLHILNNRRSITDATLDEYFRYRAQWELLRELQQKPAAAHAKPMEALPARKARRGRPADTSKSLSDFVCQGVDADEVRSAILNHLRVGSGTANDVALLIKELIDAHRLRTVVPYNLMKSEFGDLFRCKCANYNDSVRPYRPK